MHPSYGKKRTIKVVWWVPHFYLPKYDDPTDIPGWTSLNLCSLVSMHENTLLPPMVFWNNQYRKYYICSCHWCVLNDVEDKTPFFVLRKSLLYLATTPLEQAITGTSAPLGILTNPPVCAVLNRRAQTRRVQINSPHLHTHIIVVRVSVWGAGGRGSIPDRVTPKT